MQERTSDPCYLLVTPRGSFFSLLVALQNVKWHKNSGWGPQRDWLTTGEAVVMAHLFSPVACPQDPWESRLWSMISAMNYQHSQINQAAAQKRILIKATVSQEIASRKENLVQNLRPSPTSATQYPHGFWQVTPAPQASRVPTCRGDAIPAHLLHKFLTRWRMHSSTCCKLLMLNHWRVDSFSGS
ncbi:uncharacterized protein LOC117067026 isoform X1 [Trachypithecus francoisi]|uniref:uncharacterized protein LOC117067026 isoform X1 n=1 Tax=Trachypithecus francoisi TaxID=54180 RepID=UPI00141BB744|nr:uncharacterized protein LOC117067026 isoform X1 [Trachypithecus francoisi]